MSDKPKYPRAAAIEVARELCHVFRPVTTRLLVAGSLRRRKQEVGDVEILYLSSITLVPSDLLGNKEPEYAAEIAIKALLDRGIIKPRLNKDGHATWGAKNKLAVHVKSGIPVDLFAANENNWWNLVVCRTGSAAFNIRVCQAAIDKGWSWDQYGPGFWRHAVSPSGRPCKEWHHITSEQDLFTFLGLPYLEPWDR